MDKLLHFGVCFVATLVLGIAFPFGLAIGKEVGDYFNKNSHDYFGDLLADGLGILAGALIVFLLRAIT